MQTLNLLTSPKRPSTIDERLSEIVGDLLLQLVAICEEGKVEVTHAGSKRAAAVVGLVAFFEEG